VIDGPGAVRAPGLVGRRFSLVPLAPEYHRALYALTVSEQVSFRWRYQGGVPPFEVFERNLHANVLVQFAVVPRDDARTLAGLVAAYHANLQDGHVSLAAVSRGDLGTGTLEGVVLALRYLFVCWPFRKVYLEAPEFNVPQFASAVASGVLVEEGRLRAHRYFDGRYWDYLTFAIYRDAALRWADNHPGLFVDEVPAAGGGGPPC